MNIELEKFKEWLQEPAFPLPLAVMSETHDAPPRIEWIGSREARGITRLEYYLLAPNSKGLQQVLVLLAGVYGALTGGVVTDEDLQNIFLNKKAKE